MSKQWKVISGIILAVIVLNFACLVGWFALIRRWTPPLALARSPRPAAPLEIRLIDDNKDGIPDRGVLDLPLNPFGPGRDRLWGRDFEPGRPRPFTPPFAPFFLIGSLLRGLIGLAFLALLVSLTVFFYRRWQPAYAASSPVSPPVEPSSTEEAASAHDPTP
jgi:hypothetical protein